jgi:membrane protein implicated in regulation of membrane protease activity
MFQGPPLRDGRVLTIRRTNTTVALLTGLILGGFGLGVTWYFFGLWYALVGMAVLLLGVGDLAVAAWVNTKAEPQTGPEGMVGNVGTVVTAFRQNSSARCVGRVRVNGETWQAYAEGEECGAFSSGRRVVVSEQSGLWLRVRVRHSG